METGPPLLQLPHVDTDVMKRLARRRVRGMTDLLMLPASERLASFTACGTHPTHG